MKKQRASTAITPTRAENYPEWFQQVVRAADLAESSPVRGCMVIKPWGYAIWENIQRLLDGMFRETGHKNAYFPLFIPKSFLEKEAKHVKGFVKECAVVTHHRLEENSEGELVPAGKLEEPLIVRPTSETIIGDSFSRWISSYRDLPILINQWANVVRWELRPRLFLRTTEFLWQEGHTAHATAEEALAETHTIHGIYARFAEEFMALPVIKGEKTPAERFPGAERTFSIEAMMQDRKALQAGTSHFLGQNFSKAQKIRFLDDTGKQKYAWTTSWGVSTRLVGALVMAHSDDNGLVLPPRLAPAHIVILPILFKSDRPDLILEHCQKLKDALQELKFGDRNVEVEIDNRELRGGEKAWSWIKKGVPIRVEIGPRDMASDSVFLARRDQAPHEKRSLPTGEFLETVTCILTEIQDGLMERARRLRSENTQILNSRASFYEFFKDSQGGSGAGGFALAHWSGDETIAEQVQKDLQVTIRCIPLDDKEGGGGGAGTCIFSGQPSPQRVVWAKAY
jgi:prolyl-tRNA synthetase